MQRIAAALSLGAGASTDIAARRQSFRSLLDFAAGAPNVATVEPAAAPVPLRLYIPAEATSPGPALIYLHGGGFVSGGIETYDRLCQGLAAASHCRVVSVGYRLAPEHQYPAALEDAEAAALWIARHAAALGIDPSRLAIGGDSAGATLAAVLARRHGDRFALQMLLCPILDWTDDALRASGEDSPVLTAAAMVQERTYFLPPGADPAHPDISPLRAPALDGVPPTLIHTAEHDRVRPDGVRYAARLRAAGVSVQHTCHRGMIHLFFVFGRVLPHAHAALDDIGRQLAAMLAPPPAVPLSAAGVSHP